MANKKISVQDMLRIYKEVAEHHNLLSGRRIKYIDTSFDTRQGKFWKVVFRSLGGKKTAFTTTNRESEKPIDLFQEIMNWLESDEE